jgi:hypothetical protein
MGRSQGPDWSVSVDREPRAQASPRAPSRGHGRVRLGRVSSQKVRMSVPDGYSPRAPG